MNLHIKQFYFLFIPIIVSTFSCSKSEDNYSEDLTENFYKCGRKVILHETFVNNKNNWILAVEDGDLGCDSLGVCSAQIDNGLFLKTGGTKCPSICNSSASLPIPTGSYRFLAAEVKFKNFVLNFDGVYSDFEQGYVKMKYGNTSLFFGKKPNVWDDYFILDMSGKTIHFLLDFEDNQTYARVEESLVNSTDYPSYLNGSNDFTSFLRSSNTKNNEVELYSTDGRTDMGMPVEAAMSIEHIILYEPIEPCK